MSLNFINLPNPSSRTMAVGFTQTLTEISTRKYIWGTKRSRLVRLTTSPPYVTRFPKATRGIERISYKGVLLSTLLRVTVYVLLHNLLNVLLQIANKMGLQKIC
jgi:hypothetical protein